MRVQVLDPLVRLQQLLRLTITCIALNTISRTVDAVLIGVFIRFLLIGWWLMLLALLPDALVLLSNPITKLYHERFVNLFSLALYMLLVFEGIRPLRKRWVSFICISFLLWTIVSRFVLWEVETVERPRINDTDIGLRPSLWTLALGNDSPLSWLGKDAFVGTFTLLIRALAVVAYCPLLITVGNEGRHVGGEVGLLLSSDVLLSHEFPALERAGHPHAR